MPEFLAATAQRLFLWAFLHSSMASWSADGWSNSPVAVHVAPSLSTTRVLMGGARRNCCHAAAFARLRLGGIGVKLGFGAANSEPPSGSRLLALRNASTMPDHAGTCEKRSWPSVPSGGAITSWDAPPAPLYASSNCFTMYGGYQRSFCAKIQRIGRSPCL